MKICSCYVRLAARANQEAKMTRWYRAMCFNKPVGPWRTKRDEARNDLIDAGLGEYTEWGSFYITVPGDLLITYRNPVAAQAKAA